MANEKPITFCPKCKKSVEASEYFTTHGLSDWRVSFAGFAKIRCIKCGYYGLPLCASFKDYQKLVGEKVRIKNKRRQKTKK